MKKPSRPSGPYGPGCRVLPDLILEEKLYRMLIRESARAERYLQALRDARAELKQRRSWARMTRTIGRIPTSRKETK